MRHSPEFHRLIQGGPHGRSRRRPGRERWHWAELRLMLLGGAFAGLVATIWSAPAAISGAPVSAHFGFCHSGGGANCVVDGDTFWMGGEKIRVADIDAPETHPPRCAEEARRGNAATERLQALLNAGPVTLAAADRDTDRYGRKLRVVLRDGKSLGDQLVDEGLARPWGGHRRPWC